MPEKLLIELAEYAIEVCKKEPRYERCQLRVSQRVRLAISTNSGLLEKYDAVCEGRMHKAKGGNRQGNPYLPARNCLRNEWFSGFDDTGIGKIDHLSDSFLMHIFKEF